MCPPASHELIWYGSIPLLARAEQHDCDLRFRNPSIAAELEGAPAG